MTASLKAPKPPENKVVGTFSLHVIRQALCFKNLQSGGSVRMRPLGRVLSVFLVCRQAVSQRSKLSIILGEAIHAERTKAGLSQEQLAEKAGLARNYMGNVERAEYRVTVETLALIAKALNLRVRDLTWNL